jgi:hypothetical protein
VLMSGDQGGVRGPLPPTLYIGAFRPSNYCSLERPKCRDNLNIDLSHEFEPAFWSRTECRGSLPQHAAGLRALTVKCRIPADLYREHILR